MSIGIFAVKNWRKKYNKMIYLLLNLDILQKKKKKKKTNNLGPICLKIKTHVILRQFPLDLCNESYFAK
jgi:hypothetical protein